MSTSRTMLGAGDVLAGFQVEDVIGIGGMAIVYRAEQLSLRRKVALKVLSPELNSDPEFRERFRREGQHVAALDHPHVVTIYDSGEAEDGRLYMAMRLVDGSTLAQRMAETGLSADATIAILTPIAQALDAAHAQGLVHRDVKPQNILLSASGVPYLTDFGVARIASEGTALTSAGSFVGSVHYAAPEQINGEPPGTAGDVYAMTAVLYQCLSGEVPFPRDTEVAVMRAHLEEPPPTLPMLPREASRLNGAIARGMAKDPRERPARASELLGDVSDILRVLPLWRRHNIPAFGAAAEADSAASAKTVTRSAAWAQPGFISPEADALAATVHRSPISAAQVEPEAEVVPSVPMLDAMAGAGETVIAVAPPTGGPQPAAVIAEPAGASKASAAANAAGEPGSPDRRRPALIGGGSVVVLAAIGLGVALASGGSAQAPKAALPTLVTARSGPLELRYHHPWMPTRSDVLGSALLAQPIKLHDGHATLTAGAVKKVAPVPGALPAGTAAPAPAASMAHLGPYATSFYTWGGSGSQGEAWIVPTATGDYALICQAPSRAALRSCSAPAQSVRLARVTAIAPGPDASFGSSLGSALSRAVAARSRLAGLGANSLPTRGLVALRLSQADRVSIAKLRAIAAPPRYRAVTTKLELSLGREAEALKRLAHAAKVDSRKGYTAARDQATRASQGVVGARTALARYGFHLPTLSAVVIPGLPAVHKLHKATPPTSSATTQPAYTPPAISTTPPAPPQKVVKVATPSKPKRGGGLVKAKPLH